MQGGDRELLNYKAAIRGRKKIAEALNCTSWTSFAWKSEEPFPWTDGLHVGIRAEGTCNCTGKDVC